MFSGDILADQPSAAPTQASSIPAAGLQSRRPVFVVGSPRSGTTLLYDMLLSSGGFAVYSRESHVFSGLATRVGNLARRRNRELLLQRWLESKYFKPVGVDLERVKARVLDECRNPGDFLRIVMEDMARGQNVERWAEHSPDHVLYMEEIRRTVPGALFVHLIRDGRDVALSLDYYKWLTPMPWDRQHSLLLCGIYWEWLVGNGRRIGCRIGGDYTEVRFEELINSPQPTLARLGQFIGHDLDYERIRRTAIGAVGKPNTSFRSSSDNFDPISRWKKLFPPGQLANLEAMVGPLLKELGYPLATPAGELPRRVNLSRLRSFYRAYFSLRLWIKTHHLPGAECLVKDR